MNNHGIPALIGEQKRILEEPCHPSSSPAKTSASRASPND